MTSKLLIMPVIGLVGRNKSDDPTVLKITPLLYMGRITTGLSAGLIPMYGAFWEMMIWVEFIRLEANGVIP